MNCNYKKTILSASLSVYLLLALLPFSTAQIPVEWNASLGGNKIDPSKGFNDFSVVKTLSNVIVDMPDETICPGETATLDAFIGVNCQGCVYIWGDNPTNDSIRIVAPLTMTTYNVTLTDDLVCTATDAVTIIVGEMRQYRGDFTLYK
jgi:hypothetical protein